MLENYLVKLTLYDESDNSFWFGAIVDETAIFRAVLGSYGMKMQGKCVREQRNTMSVFPYSCTLTHVFHEFYM
jgi:hypothetical protein